MEGNGQELERIGPTWFDRMRHGRRGRDRRERASEWNGLDWLAGTVRPGCVAEGIGTKRLGQAARDWQEGTDRTRQGLG